MPLPALWLLVKRAIYHTISHAAVKLHTHCFLRSVTHFFMLSRRIAQNLEKEKVRAFLLILRIIE